MWENKTKKSLLTVALIRQIHLSGMLVWKASRTSLTFLVFNQREEAREEIFEVLVGREREREKEKNNLITSWRKLTDICLDDLHLWNVCLHHSDLFSDFSDLLISSESARSVFSRLRSRGRHQAEISQCQSLCYAIISLCSVRQLRLSC